MSWKPARMGIERPDEMNLLIMTILILLWSRRFHATPSHDALHLPSWSRRSLSFPGHDAERRDPAPVGHGHKMR